MGDYDGAIVAFTKALQLDPQHKNALSGLAWSQLKKGDYNGSLVAFNKVLQLDPQNKDALSGYLAAEITIKHNKGDYTGARIAREQLLELRSRKKNKGLFGWLRR